MPRPIIIDPLKERFARLYTSGDIELFGNGRRSALYTYFADEWELDEGKEKKRLIMKADKKARTLLRNNKVLARCDQLLDARGFNDTHVDKQHLFLINQMSDLPTKLGAIREYNKVKGRVKEADADQGVTVVVKNYADKKKEVEEDDED